MKILILNWRDPKNPLSGGAEIVTMQHAKAWAKKGHQVVWFASGFKGAVKKEIIDGVRIVRRGNWLTVYLLAPFYYFFSGEKFDLAVDEFHGLPFFTPLYIRKPKIALAHEVADDIWNYMYPFPINILGRSLESLYFRLYKNVKFWTDANSTVEDLKKYGIKETNCTAISCALSNECLKVLPQKEIKPTFIFVSRLVKMKGIEEVIKAFSFILKEKKSAKLWIVGAGEKSYIEKLKTQAREYNIDKRLTFFGPVSDKKKLELMQKAHLLLHASVKEGWGLVVIEAASRATPCVVYNVSGLCDCVQNGKTGIVLKNNSPVEMAREALKLFNDRAKYKTMQENALRWAKSLTWEKATRESLKLLEEAGNKT